MLTSGAPVLTILDLMSLLQQQLYKNAFLDCLSTRLKIHVGFLRFSELVFSALLQ